LYDVNYNKKKNNDNNNNLSNISLTILGSRLCTSIRKNALNDVISQLFNENVAEFINSTNDSGKTPLFVAAIKGHIDILIELLNCTGINPHAPNTDGKTPFLGRILRH
jgi:ankyrin repeat protein